MREVRLCPGAITVRQNMNSPAEAESPSDPGHPSDCLTFPCFLSFFSENTCYTLPRRKNYNSTLSVFV